MINRVDCIICKMEIVKPLGDIFNMDKDNTGPFCDTCFFFVHRLEELTYRIKNLEAIIKTRWNPKRLSPYDASRRRCGN